MCPVRAPVATGPERNLGVHIGPANKWFSETVQIRMSVAK